MLTQKQLTERKNGIYGTDCGVILGVNPYESSIDLWREKLGLQAAKDLSENKKVISGLHMELGVRSWFEEEHNQVVLTIDAINHPEHSWMRGHPDGVLRNYQECSTQFEDTLVEFKTVSRTTDAWGVDGENKIPDYYLTQLIHYMACGGYPKAILVAFFHDSHDFRCYYFDRDLALEAKVIEKLKHFWEVNIKQETMPEPVTHADLLAKYKESQPGLNKFATEEDCYNLQRLKQLKESCDHFEDEYNKIKTLLIASLGDAEKLIDPLSEKMLISYKSTKPREYFDSVKFKKENPELAADYVKIGEPSRPFKPVWEKENER